MKKYREFLKIAEYLNKKLNIVPILYGSLGLAIVLDRELDCDDIDVLIPDQYLDEGWKDFQCKMKFLRFDMCDEPEHEFENKKIKVGFARESGLMKYVDINPDTLKIIEVRGTRYKILSLQQYKKVYEKSVQDSYRIKTGSQHKDVVKIDLINNAIKKYN